MAGIVVADTLQAASTSTLVIKNGVASTPPTVQDSAGTEIGTFCRAWVNFNGTTVTNPASMTGVRASFNVSSILDNGTGDYTVNFTTAMPDANYSVVAGANGRATDTTPDVGVSVGVGATTVSGSVATGTRIVVGNPSSAEDSFVVTLAVFR